MARKAGVFLLLAVLIFVFAADAEAARQRFGNVEADVPAGWTTQEAENQVTIIAPDNVAVVSIITNIIEGTTMRAVAEDIAREYNSSAPQAAEGVYVLGFRNEHGIDYRVIVSGDESTGFYMVWITAGEHAQLGALIESIEWVE